MHRTNIAAALVPLALFCASHAAQAADVRCSLKFTMKSWSAFYKASNGSGTVTCDNGESAKVRLTAKGGGLTAGISTVDDGYGEFTGVSGIEDVLGAYVSAEATAAAVKAAKGQVMTKGEVSVALSGTGRGWDLGVAFGKLTITRR